MNDFKNDINPENDKEENIIKENYALKKDDEEKVVEENFMLERDEMPIEARDMVEETFAEDEDERLKQKRRKLEELRKLQIEEIKEKKEKRKKHMRRFNKNVMKTAVLICCCFSLGIGVSVGGNFAKTYIENKERTDFRFNNQDVDSVSMTLDDDFVRKTSVSEMFKQAGDSVVNISTKVSTGFFNQDIQDASSGSGIIYKVDGDKVYIITNNHVIENAEYVTVSVTGEEQVNAKLIGTDPRSDLAVLSVSKMDMKQAGIEKVNVAKFADSDTVEVGDFVFPIGNALGRGKTMTNGMISAQNKEINIDGKSLTVLQTDAAINPGNSGGALMNIKGEVVGINTAKLSSSAIEGIGYAIPTNIAVEVVDQIIELGYVQRPYFGIAGKTITEKTKNIYGINVDGVLVVDVEKNSNADKAGLEKADIIVSFNGAKIKTLEDLSEAIKKCKPNDEVSFDIIREGTKKMTLSVKLVPASTKFKTKN